MIGWGASGRKTAGMFPFFRKKPAAKAEPAEPAPPPAAVSEGTMQRVARGVFMAAAAVILVAGMKAASAILTQVLVILFLAIVISPVYDALRRLRVPSAAAVALLILLLVGGCLYLSLVVLPAAVMEFAYNAKVYWAQILAASHDVRDALAANGVAVPEKAAWDQSFSQAVALNAKAISGIAVEAMKFLGGLVMNVVTVLIVTSFLLCELPGLPQRARRMRWMTPARYGILARFVRDVRHYMGIKTVISALTGLAVYAGLRVLRVDSPELLGIVAFLLNFIPVFGSILAAVPGVLLALSAGGVPTAVWAAAVYVAANQLLGNVLEPRIMGTGFGVSPVVVLLSVIFWGWVLGPVGMIFAVPLTMAIRGTLASMYEERVPPPAADPPEPSSAGA